MSNKLNGLSFKHKIPSDDPDWMVVLFLSAKFVEAHTKFHAIKGNTQVENCKRQSAIVTYQNAYAEFKYSMVQVGYDSVPDMLAAEAPEICYTSNKNSGPITRFK